MYRKLDPPLRLSGFEATEMFPDEYVLSAMMTEIQIGEWVGCNWPMLTCLSHQFKFLLGTDSMQFFDWYFEYGKMQCSYDLVPDKRKMLFGNLEQSIHTVDEVR